MPALISFSTLITDPQGAVGGGQVAESRVQSLPVRLLRSRWNRPRRRAMGTCEEMSLLLRTPATRSSLLSLEFILVLAPESRGTPSVARVCFDSCFYDGLLITGQRKLFELLVLSGALGELMWHAILNKRPIFRKVFKDFDPVLVSKLSEKKIIASVSPSSSLLSEQKYAVLLKMYVKYSRLALIQ